MEHTMVGEIIARAGEPGAVTVATNMAGRGVDIMLGGGRDGVDEKEWQQRHDEIIRKGGLQIIGTERHDSRRIDNQLRGRAGRQGDPGRSLFFLSLEDDIMRRFGGDRIKTIMGWAGMGDDAPLQNTLVNKTITDVQKRVEGYHFDVRKHLVEYDDVVNKHRELIYEERRKILGGADLKLNILSMVADEIRAIVASRLGSMPEFDWDIPAMLVDISAIFPLPRSFNVDALAGMKPKEIEDQLIKEAEAAYEAKEQEMGDERMRLLERLVMLQVVDRLWVEHLTDMEHERLQAGWASLRQMKSTDAYKRSGYEYFEQLKENIRHDVARTVFHVRARQKGASGEAPKETKSPMAAASGSKDAKPVARPGGKKTGRNDPCPCGSGKKYKHCCGK
jgi:preprotein translocase subunit SecA